ncbi:MAG: class I SAM-dependent methyltransferase [Halobacteriota archaeon]
MNNDTICIFCGTSTAEIPAAESAKVRSNVREFSVETFTVWRCAKCGSLHAQEPINPDRYYQNYAISRWRYDSVMKTILRKRTAILKRAGLKSGNTLLDYGCGSGHFVRYAREHGVRAEGYDPYSEEFKDASVLDHRYDFVTTQDVLEHVENPRVLVDNLKGYACPGGCIAIGTPNADSTDLRNSLDLGVLHQPYHRHIASTAELQRMAVEGGWEVVQFRKGSFADTWVPFINTAFANRFVERSGGFIDDVIESQSDPTSAREIIKKNPSLIFWGLFGSFFSRKTEMVVVARALS